MNNTTRPVKSDDRQPEALASLASTARNGGERPLSIDDPASADGEALPADPARKANAATRVLREGVMAADQNADDAIDALPDRAAQRGDEASNSSG